jgi:hypothetical protein
VCVEGYRVIGFQIETRWRLWAGDNGVEDNIPKEEAWTILNRAAEESEMINF